jgi:hypothetical protein
MTATITTPSPVATTAVRTSPLLRAGIVAGPFFALAGFAQMPFRPGFDLTKHAFSFLLIGDQGWIQGLVFVVTGLLYAAAGFGLRRHLRGRVGAIAAVLAVLLGIGKIIAGLNAPQPSFGYPIGTPDGPPAVLTTASILHGVGFGIAVLSWTALLVTLGVALRRRGVRGTGNLALATSPALLAVPATSAQPFGTVLLYVVVTSAYVVTSLTFARLAGTPARP